MPRKLTEGDPEPIQRRPDEIDLVRQHAFALLREMGFTYDHADLLCERRDIVHEAKDLLDKGCSVELAARILL